MEPGTFLSLDRSHFRTVSHRCIQSIYSEWIYAAGTEERQGFFIPATKHPSLELMTFGESKSQTASVWISISSLSFSIYTATLLPLKLFFLFLWEFFYSNLFFPPSLSLYCHSDDFLSIAILIYIPPHPVTHFTFFPSISSSQLCWHVSLSLCVSVCTYILMGNSIRDGLQRAEGSLSDLGCMGEGD